MFHWNRDGFSVSLWQQRTMKWNINQDIQSKARIDVTLITDNDVKYSCSKLRMSYSKCQGVSYTIIWINCCLLIALIDKHISCFIYINRLQWWLITYCLQYTYCLFSSWYFNLRLLGSIKSFLQTKFIKLAYNQIIVIIIIIIVFDHQDHPHRKQEIHAYFNISLLIYCMYGRNKAASSLSSLWSSSP